jgi:galactokinase
MAETLAQGEPAEWLQSVFGGTGEIRTVSVPGRVNLIGEHIDYHGLQVMPIALGRRIRLAWRRRDDRRIRAISSAQQGVREFEWTGKLPPAAAGDWENYLRAAAQAVAGKWGVGRGIDAAIVSDLPAAAGLASSSALMVAFTLGLLRANGCNPAFEQFMEVLPAGEQFVGTHGGGMDHAASLASLSGHASYIQFDPLAIRYIPVPAGWGFLIAHSGVLAEKSAAAREEFNARRRAGSAALRGLGLSSYREACPDFASRLPSGLERDAFLHVTTEAERVEAAAQAMTSGDAVRFGNLLTESHRSLRDRLRVSCAELDQLVATAIHAGAEGARVTGAGFGGCVLIFAQRAKLEAIRCALRSPWVIEAAPSAGALHQPDL